VVDGGDGSKPSRASPILRDRSDFFWKPPPMQTDDSVVAIFATHAGADAAVKTLAAHGFDFKQLSVLGKGYHTEEHAAGFYNMGDKMKFWGERGAVWGGLWGLFFGGLFMAVPVVGHVVILGYLAGIVYSGVQSAVLVGGIGAIAAALGSIGIPKDSVVRYETAIKADDFLVMAHGTAAEMERARVILKDANPKQVYLHNVASAQAAA
jgi:hypothetical protein